MASGYTEPMQHESAFMNVTSVVGDYNTGFHRRPSSGGPESQEGELCVIEPGTQTVEVIVKSRKGSKKRKKYNKDRVSNHSQHQDSKEYSTKRIETPSRVHTETFNLSEPGSVVTGSVEGVDNGRHSDNGGIHGGDAGSQCTELGGYSRIHNNQDESPISKKSLHVRIDPCVEDITEVLGGIHMDTKGMEEAINHVEQIEKNGGILEVKDETVVQEKGENGTILEQQEVKVKVNNGVRQRVKPRSSQHEEQSSSDGTEEDEKFLDWVKTQFIKVAGEDNSIDLDEFKQALGIKNSYFAERFFALFDKEGSKTIDLSEFVEGMTLLTKGSPQQKLKFLFDAYDVDGNGVIDPDELKVVMKHCIEESELQLCDEALETLTLALFDHADSDGSGMISYDELCDVLEKHPDVMNNLTISAANWMKPPKSKSSKPTRRPDIFTKNYWMNNKKSIIWVFIYFIINIGLFLTCIRYRESNAAVIIARGCGMCLNFNCAFVLVLMLKNSLTLLRMTPLAQVFPIDENVAYHRAVGYMIVALALVHTIAHYVNVALVLDDAVDLPTNKYWEYVFTLKAQVGYVGPGFAYLSGFILTVILMIMFICALPFIRSKGLFQVFYFTHLLYLVFWVILLLHGPIFWCFFIIPGLIFVLEKLLPPFLRRAKGTTFYIKTVTLLPSKVTHLVVGYSGHFHFKPGDYVFINIPGIAKFEFHPFTISSAPEKDGEFWLHVRSAGHWTKGLYKYFEDYNIEDVQKSRHSVKSSSIAPITGSVRGSSAASQSNKESSIDNWRNKYKTKSLHIPVSIRGPYGTPTREIFDTEHVVLIACGIGVTPFASILQSISYRVRAAKKTCPYCTHVFLDQDHVTQNMKLRKVDFIWINRQQHSFEWFVSLLQQLEEEEEADSAFDHFLDMQMYMTSALSMNDMKGFGLQVALDAMQKKGQRNVLTGLRSSLKPGRPNWDKVFSKVKAENKGSVKVFFCGNPILAKSLKANCEKFGFAFSKETF